MTTQLQQAKNGIITPEMEAISQSEQVNAAWLRDEIALGHVVLPKNVNHTFPPKAIGRGLSTKINGNIGSSEKHCRVEAVLEKPRTAIAYGADSVMDLSTAGDLHAILQEIIRESSVMVGTVPIYSVATRLLAQGKKIAEMDPEAIFEEIETQARMGVDFMTLHCGVSRS